MTKLAWDTSFRRAFKRRTRNNRALQERVFQTLEQLAEEPSLETSLPIVVARRASNSGVNARRK